MNQKAEKFDLLVADLNKGGNSWFTKEEMTDDLNTVVYHGRLDVHEHSLPVFIVVDDSAFSYARIAITTTVPGLTEQFDPTVVVNLLLEVVQPHLDAVHKGILKVAGLA